MGNFYINRLKTFSIAEFPYRVKQLITRKMEEKFGSTGAYPAVRVMPSVPILDSCPQQTGVHPDTITIFGKEFNYGNIQAGDWHRDIFSGKSFPMSFSKNINIRKDRDLSAKCVWEVNRLQFLVQVALNFRQTKSEAELTKFISINRSWKQANPYLYGVNWYSNIEVNLRLINWFLCWELLEADKLITENEAFKQFAEDDWMPLIYRHCLYSYKNPSKFSSANNHLISEYAGLFVAAVKWPFQESAQWIRYAQTGLEAEIIKQHSKNGINKEEAAEYIQFITDFFLVAYVVGERSKQPFSKQFKEQLRVILQYIFNFLDCKGNFPKYGDEDDGKCFIVDFDESFNNFKSLLGSGAVIFNDPVLKSKSNGFDIKNQILFGEAGKSIFDSLTEKQGPENSVLYKEEGHFILRKKENDREVYLHVDAAPLGFLSIAAHGHADALSFLLHVDGQPVFADSGTYTYHTEPEWRDYFIGTLAHNTVRINKLNQATIAGSTLWLQHYACEVLHAATNEFEDIIKAKHNGYKSLGIIHTREIIFDKRLLQVRITDHIESKKQEAYLMEVPFHIHPAIKINGISDHEFELINAAGRNVILQTDPKLKTALVKGQIEPEITGWYSGSFLKKEPCNTIICTLKTAGNIQLETIISIK